MAKEWRPACASRLARPKRFELLTPRFVVDGRRCSSELAACESTNRAQHRELDRKLGRFKRGPGQERKQKKRRTCVCKFCTRIRATCSNSEIFRPIHHRAIHRCDAPFDFHSNVFAFVSGVLTPIAMDF